MAAADLNGTRRICASVELLDSAHGVRFALPHLGPRVTGFAVRYQGTVYAFVNQCAHVPVELDWNEGDFFDLSKHYLICATHGAQYQPQTGYCVLGPCKGKRLTPIKVLEQEGEVHIVLDAGTHGPLD